VCWQSFESYALCKDLWFCCKSLVNFIVHEVEQVGSGGTDPLVPISASDRGEWPFHVQIALLPVQKKARCPLNILLSALHSLCGRFGKDINRKSSRDLLAVLVTISTACRLHLLFVALGLTMIINEISSRHVKTDMDAQRSWPHQFRMKNALACKLKHTSMLRGTTTRLCMETSDWTYSVRVTSLYRRWSPDVIRLSS
jgi:hypothetical protein